MLKFCATAHYECPKALQEKYPQAQMICVNSDRTYERDRPDHLLKQDVLIDGKEYHVQSVESPAIATIRKNVEIGLLVTPTNKSEDRG